MEQKIENWQVAETNFVKLMQKNKDVLNVEHISLYAQNSEWDVLVQWKSGDKWYVDVTTGVRKKFNKPQIQGKYEFNFPIIEEPPRAINSLYNLAKGNALIHNRTFLRSEDLEIVRAVCLSSMPHDRVEFLKLLAKHEGKLTTSQIQSELNCSDETARRTMNIFKILGIVDIKSIQIDYSGTGRPMNYIEIKEEFKELLTHTQVLNDLENHKPTQNRGEGDDYESIKPEDFIKKEEKGALSHPVNDLENTNPRELNPVCEDIFVEK